MSSIPLTAGIEASNRRPTHKSPGPAFKPGPADFKAAKKAEHRAEEEQCHELWHVVMGIRSIVKVA
ncbi:hypothetical protein CCUS01_14287 [Colletotrichum cuscutae]|uniref:Uncharacterized protein n=1 Tax=Colletotrichum cuscutae TaxID=1209917 RepID=A0AAI9Y9F8_9PEZI|nr:hypothetical protein CCUS01_14287 [Colletotrichum cuscutae]